MKAKMYFIFVAAMVAAYGFLLGLSIYSTRQAEVALIVGASAVCLLAYERAKNVKMFRESLAKSAFRIAHNHNHAPTSKWVALRKLFIQEKRDHSLPDSPIVGWKRGELAEFLMAKNSAEISEEWGDVGYYLAQSFSLFWAFYALVTPPTVLRAAVEKFDTRAWAGAMKKI